MVIFYPVIKLVGDRHLLDLLQKKIRSCFKVEDGQVSPKRRYSSIKLHDVIL